MQEIVFVGGKAHLTASEEETAKPMQKRSAAVGDGWLGFLLPHGRRFQYVYVAAISLQTGTDRLRQTCFILRLRSQGTHKVDEGKSRLGNTLASQIC
ncbi:hypothetical protein GW17_00061534 [Ensete ventricosum]|nr:hypothetical protein GW17_00061534 [Ensete ventricosum]